MGCLRIAVLSHGHADVGDHLVQGKLGRCEGFKHRVTSSATVRERVINDKNGSSIIHATEKI